jgi:hypothetical protein
MNFQFQGMRMNRQPLCGLRLRMAVLVGASLLIVPAWPKASDTIYFKDGMRTVCGGHAWDKGDEIHCEYDGGLLIYPKSDVARIEKGPAVEPGQDSEPDRTPDPPQARPVPPTPAAATAAAAPVPFKSSAGIAFYDPRRPKKYWSSESRHHDTFREAIAALAEDYNRPAAWIEENLGDSNELSDIRETLAARIAKASAANPASAPAQGAAIEFYNPRRVQKYMTGPDAYHNSFQDALDALARDFNQPADWVEQHMGESNDIDQIRQNLNNAQPAEIMK